MKVVFVSTEAVPFAKTGGLGDVIGSLPRELTKHNVEVRVILPLYKTIKESYGDQLRFLKKTKVTLAWRKCYCGIFEMEYDGVIFWFIDNEQYFGRDGLYGYNDDGERFAFFSKAALDAIAVLDYDADILHCSEWQTALIPVYLKTLYKSSKPHIKIKSVFTIHNIEYQGLFGWDVLEDVLGLSDEQGEILEHHGCLNFMKGGIVACDRLTTVSPTYAEEIKNSFFGRGLETIIQKNSKKLSGILNGIDRKRYNPAKDKALSVHYSYATMEKKALVKRALQEELGLSISEKTPLIGMVGRLAEHKGLDLVATVFDDLLKDSMQFVLLGTGERKYEDFFREKAKEYPDHVAVITGFSETLASCIYAGADMFLMPSISEPCGLSQMIALRYGTIPIVRETGGLKDSVIPFNPITKKGNGITFGSVNAHDMLFAVRRGQTFYKNQEEWKLLMRNAFLTDLSWTSSAEQYIKIYQDLLQ